MQIFDEEDNAPRTQLIFFWFPLLLKLCFMYEAELRDACAPNQSLGAIKIARRTRTAGSSCLVFSRRPRRSFVESIQASTPRSANVSTISRTSLSTSAAASHWQVVRR